MPRIAAHLYAKLLAPCADSAQVLRKLACARICGTAAEAVLMQTTAGCGLHT